MSPLTKTQRGALWRAPDNWQPVGNWCGIRSVTLRALRRRGLIRQREIYREANEFGVGETAERAYYCGCEHEWRITAAGRAALRAVLKAEMGGG